MNNLSLFIIGMPRSGTKLFRELLNNHKEIFIPEIETLFIPQLLKKYGDKRLTSIEVNQVISELKGSLFFFYYTQKYEFDLSTLEIRNVTIVDLINHLFVQLAEQRDIHASVLGDKSPNYINYIELLQKNYSSAKFIHIVRDPRDYVLSMENAWGKNMFRAAYRWNKSIIRLNNNLSENIYEIKYEELIRSPEHVLTKVCDFLSISFDKSMIKLNRSVENLGEAKFDKIKKDNSNKFLDNLSNNQLRKIENLVFEGLQKYNYEIYSTNIINVKINRIRLLYWKFFDALNLIKFNIRKYGFKKGLKKILKASKYS